MKNANFPESELNLLFASQNESDDLTNLEHKAMNAIKGIFQDKDGNYTIKGEPDFALAGTYALNRLSFGKNQNHGTP